MFTFLLQVVLFILGDSCNDDDYDGTIVVIWIDNSSYDDSDADEGNDNDDVKR